MVNTFITYRKRHGSGYKPAYYRSAQSLDIPRLRKQCVEAYQILNILRHIHKICKLLNLSSEKDFLFDIDETKLSSLELYNLILKRTEWVKFVRKEYLSKDFRYAKIDGSIVTFPKNKLPSRIYNTDRYEIHGNDVYVYKTKSKLENYVSESNEKYKVIPRNKIILPSDELFTLGFSQHAIVKMWVGYENSLKKYINAHIDVYCSLTKKDGTFFTMNIQKYQIKADKVHHPWWITKYKGVIFSHRASLLRKEISRNESVHYQHIKHFTYISDEWKTRGYVWTCSLSDPTLILDILNGVDIHPSSVCAPINEKSLSEK
jgi:hypothetical protein